MDAISTGDDGISVVDDGRCIGCGLCITTCPSGALRLEEKAAAGVPPDDTRALYLKIMQERYGPWGMAKLGMRKALGVKI
jgi:Fe-S-cluster-containing hydrogenase component 2